MNTKHLSVKTILAQNSHRPWVLPTGSWNFYQEWNRVVFLHWQLPVSELAAFVPDELEIDTIDGMAWVSVVVFDMNNIRPRNLPAVSMVSDFFEVNVRTYIKREGKTGVYFLSIEGSKKLSCYLARKISGLPYRYEKMTRSSQHFKLESASTCNKLNMSYGVRDEVCDKTPLDIWLTERYALFQDVAGKIKSFDIHHIEWPVHKLYLKNLELSYPLFSFLNRAPDLVHYSPGVAVVAW